MKISELKIGEKADIEATVTDIGETRSFVRFGRPLRVATATLKDDSGEIKISLWNEDIDKVKPGVKIKLTNGFVKEFQGEKQVTTGKLGKIEVMGEAEAAEKPEEKVKEEKIEEGKE